MTNIHLKHNPFLIKTEIYVANKILKENWVNSIIFENNTPKRFQLFLPEIVKAISSRYPNCQLEFSGVQCDYDDLVSEIEYREQKGIKVKRGNILDINDVYGKLRNLIQGLSNASVSDFKDLNLKDELEKITNKQLDVSVMAPMSSGKSTFINAILGQDLLPTKDTRCTSKITYIRALNTRAPFQAKKILKSGKQTEFHTATKEILEEWNNDDSVTSIQMKGKMPGVDTSENELLIIDTPGPDSLNPEDARTIEELLSNRSQSMICFIIKDLNSASKDYLRQIRDKMENFGRQSEDRFLFIIPKIDELDNEMDKNCKGFNDNPLAEKISEFRKGLKGLGFRHPKIFPVTAINALMVRSTDIDDLTRNQKRSIDAIVEMFYEKLENRSIFEYATLNHTMVDSLYEQIPQSLNSIEDCYSAIPALSGISAVEATMSEYLEKYLLPARIYDAHTKLKEEFSKIKNNLSINKEIKNNKTQLNKISSLIENFNKAVSENKALLEKEKDLRNSKFEASKNFKQNIVNQAGNISLTADKLLENFKSANKANLLPELAANFKDKFVQETKNLTARLSLSFEKEVQKEIKTKKDEIVYEYRSIFKKILEDSHFSTTLNAKLQSIIEKGFSINTSKVENPSLFEKDVKITWAEDGILKYLGSKVWLVSDSKKIVDIVSLEKTLRSFATNMRQNAIDISSKVAKERYESLKNEISEGFIQIKDEINLLEEEILKKEINKSELEKDIARLEKDVASIDEKEKDINKILEV